MLRKCFTILLLTASVASNIAVAWGEKGHNLVSVIAVDLLKQKSNHEPKLMKPFEVKREMLGHVSNIPDIYWRSLDKELTKVGNPAHYIDWEYLHKKPTFDNIPAQWEQLQKLYDGNCDKKNKSFQDCPPKRDKDFYLTAGYNPWRVLQFWTMGRDALKKANTEKNETKRVELVNDALLYFGLMSHFVADLSNPLHNTSDYDGWHVHQGKLHAYYETVVVDKLGPELAGEVYAFAKKKQPSADIYKTIPKEKKSDPLSMTLSLSFAAYDLKEKLFTLDKKHSLLAGSKQEGEKRVGAKRKSPEQVKDQYKPFVVSQLAIAADVLADLWLLAWKDAGSPDLSDYHSYHYHFKPDFIGLPVTK